MKISDFYSNYGDSGGTTALARPLSENGQFGDAVVFTIKDGKITDSADSAEPSNLFVTPGFVNTHMHWLMLGESSLNSAIDLARDNPEEMLKRIMKTAEAYLQNGVTTCLDKGPPRINTGKIYQELNKRLTLNDKPAPRTYYSSSTISVEGAFASSITRTVESKEDLVAVIKKLKDRGSKIVKIIPETHILTDEFKYDPVFPDEYFKIARELTNELGMLLAAHAKGEATIDMCLKHRVDCVEHGLEASADQLKEMQKRDVFLAPTLEGLRGRLEQTRKQAGASAIAAYEWGRAMSVFQNTLTLNNGEPFTHFTFGSDGGSAATPHASLKELYLMRKRGLSPSQCFKAATINGAKLLKKEDELGSIQAGFAADMIFWSQNPLDLPLQDWENLERHIVGVIAAGKPYSSRPKNA